MENNEKGHKTREESVRLSERPLCQPKKNESEKEKNDACCMNYMLKKMAHANNGLKGRPLDRRTD